MIGYVTLGSNQFEAAVAFYDALLASIGASRVFETDGFIAWSRGKSAHSLAVVRPWNGEPATPGNGTMVALSLDTPAAVDDLHAKALALGASDEGAPGARTDSFYAGYFRDLDGNKLAGYCFTGSIG